MVPEIKDHPYEDKGNGATDVEGQTEVRSNNDAEVCEQYGMDRQD